MVARFVVTWLWCDDGGWQRCSLIQGIFLDDGGWRLRRLQDGVSRCSNTRDLISRDSDSRFSSDAT
ncbi:Transmembrane channel-like protein 2 [Sesbania bispinosa]|nr:Transmembrane channel-like protein 2 [Sesbania bispinosa]